MIISLSEQDLSTLQAAVENMRSVSDPTDEIKHNHFVDARWRIAWNLEQIVKRAYAQLAIEQQIKERTVVQHVSDLDQVAQRLWDHFCPGISQSDEDIAFYRAAARLVLEG